MYEQIATIFLVAVVLGMDAFALSLGIGLKGASRKYETRLIITITILHIIMPLIGLTIGLVVGKIFGVWAARIGALVLAYISISFILDGYREIKPSIYLFKEGQQVFKENNSLTANSWSSIILLGISVSIDALTVSFSLGTFKMPIFLTIGIIGFTAGIMTWLGFIGGRIFSRVVGSYAQIAGGIILLALAIKLVI
ncbi:MAG TPA: manganese efflux pump [Syntrophomonadaceae bacterium]|nr:manganese efflux pump [Syntrophomonadaceae bacterium]